VKIITHLESFRGESSFSSWVYRVAANHLLTTRKRHVERKEVTFDYWERRADEGLEAAESYKPPEAEQDLFSKEILIRCLLVVLVCLSRELRIAYILSAVYGLNSEEGAEILEISPAAFRKRVSRARNLMRHHMTRKCGLVRSENPCRCEKQVSHAVEIGWVKPDNLIFARHPQFGSRKESVNREGLKMTDDMIIEELFRNLPGFSAPDSFLIRLKQAIASGRIDMGLAGFTGDPQGNA
jgi:RNA polymerase sigma factor (sigma-70 family)